mgnify:CR=1 FL=1
MRRKGTPCKYPVRADRITPAYAGKRLEDTCCTDTSWDHPRLCGEKGTFGVDTSTTTGITPAYAGKRISLDYANTSI